MNDTKGDDLKMEPFTKYYDFLKEYCKESPLNYDKIMANAQCGNQEFFCIQRFDKEKGKRGLLDETPAEVLLTVYHNEDGSFTVVEGKNAKKYLYDD